MALVLTIPKGNHVFVGDRKVSVEQIKSETQVVLRVHDRFMDKLVEVDTTSSVEILPKVRVSVGLWGTLTHAKLAFEAPREIRIMRSEIINQPPRAASA